MKLRVAVLVLVGLVALSPTGVFASSLTIGSMDSGNCYPFLCNDSGSSVGVSMDYQQAYAASSFSGPMNITGITYEFDPNTGGSAYILGGAYDLYWGYSSVGLNLTSNFAANYNGGSTYLGSGSGGFNFGQFLTANVNFNYDPGQGDLLLEWVVSNQDNVPNGSGNGYMWADYTGSVTTRAYCIGGCISSTTGALVTTFDGTLQSVPEPGSTLLLLSFGLAGVVGVARRKFMD